MRLRPTSDWFNPMLVRDLRQGLRSRGFTVGFLVLQSAMVFFVVLGLASGSSQDVGETLTGVFGVGTFFFFLLCLPLMATFGFTAEFSEGRLDLLRLTQLSARSLLAGKWLSLCVQGWLVAVTLLPYIVLRYFIGGFDLTGQLAVLALVLAFSALLVGVCLALACLNSAIVRVVSTILTIVFLVDLGFAAPFGSSGFLQFSVSGLVNLAKMLAVIGPPLLWLCLEFGAARLAPAAENHDTGQRWMVILLFGLSLLGHAYQELLHTGRAGMPLLNLFDTYATCMVIWVLVQAAAEEPSPFPHTFRPFVRWGRLGRMLGRLILYQGWPSAVPFTLLVAGLFFTEGLIFNLATLSKLSAFCALLPPAVLFPQVAGWSLRSTSIAPRARYLLVVVACTIFTVALLIVSSVNGRSPALTLPICLAPPPAWVLLWSNYYNPGGYARAWSYDYTQMAWILAALTSVPTMLFALLAAVRHWPKFASLEERAERTVKLQPGFSAVSPIPPPPPTDCPATAPTESTPPA